MRKPIFYALFACTMLFAGAMTISSCGSSQKSETEESATEAESTDAEESVDEQVAYACPMHPEETGKKGDKCSKCGMDLEPVSEEAADSTAHDHEHQ